MGSNEAKGERMVCASPILQDNSLKKGKIERYS